MGLRELKLKQDVSTRWNSTYEMLKIIFKLKDAVPSTLSLSRPELMLSSEDWEIVCAAIEILLPFYEITMEVSGEKHVTLSKVTVLCNLLEGYIAKCQHSNEKIKRLLANLQSGISSRFGGLEKNYLYAESTILDPRFKRKGFKNEYTYECAVRALRAKISSTRVQNIEERATRPTTTVVSDQGPVIWKTYDLDFNKTVKPDNSLAACTCEFDKYLNEEYLERTADSLLWWK